MATVFNRNIITKTDIHQLSQASAPGNVPETLATSPPAGAQINPAAALGGVPVPTADDYITKLLKYVPVEILGAYLFIQSVVNSNVTTKRAHAVWLLCLLIVALLFTAAYDRWVLIILRPVQLGVSVLGLAIYVFALGGWFATTAWYHAWYASIAVPIFAILVSLIKLNPLPTPGGAAGAGTP
jgi:hypothetical protein